MADGVKTLKLGTNYAMNGVGIAAGPTKIRVSSGGVAFDLSPGMAKWLSQMLLAGVEAIEQHGR